jgi:hypothetical protein
MHLAITSQIYYAATSRSLKTPPCMTHNGLDSNQLELSEPTAGLEQCEPLHESPCLYQVL